MDLVENSGGGSCGGGGRQEIEERTKIWITRVIIKKNQNGRLEQTFLSWKQLETERTNENLGS